MKKLLFNDRDTAMIHVDDNKEFNYIGVKDNDNGYLYYIEHSEDYFILKVNDHVFNNRYVDRFKGPIQEFLRNLDGQGYTIYTFDSFYDLMKWLIAPYEE